MNGHDLMVKHKKQSNKERYINKIGIGHLSLLTQRRMFKDDTFNVIFNKLSRMNGIPLEHLLIYNYTERKNKTYRPNRQIALKYNEQKALNANDGISEEMILTHTIPTSPRRKHIKSIHERIGDLIARKVRFYAFSLSYA